MGRSWWTVLLLLGACKGCKRCGPDLPDPPDSDRDSDDSGDSADSAPDSVPDPPCDYPEIEPNDGINQGTFIALEHEGCGAFNQDSDLDVWKFSFPTEAWLGLHVDSRELGSSADPTLVLSSEGGQSAIYGTLTFGEDVHMVFPSLKDDYTILLTEQQNRGGEDYYYNLLATHTKAPTSWNVDEAESNDTWQTAQQVDAGARVLGWPENAVDTDWYRLRIPEGDATVTISIESWVHGSAADHMIVVYDELLNPVTDLYLGEHGWEPDPWGQLPSDGDEDLLVRIVEEYSRSGRATWYVLSFEVEGK